ncbi:MAG: HK97 gp10 family phage protein [Hyphomicrobiales bacterium]|nr:HK97 gp10 family phage protein [Hyphomicrobiales bacterium]
MSETPTQFILGIDDLVEDLAEDAVVKLTQKLAITGLTGVVLKSPVDTGRFRGNWNVGVSNMDLSTSENTDASGGTTISSGTSAIMGASAYEVIWLTNNLPYAQALENRHSKQAPAGVVAPTFAELESIVK